MFGSAKYGVCALAGLACERVALRAPLAGNGVDGRCCTSACAALAEEKFKLCPADCTGGATSWTWVADEAPVAFAQLLIQVVKIWPQALAIGEPAVVTAAHLHDHRRGRGLRQIDHRVGLRIGEVHIVAAREVRHLRGSGRVVALAAAVLAADVVPQIDLEGLHVRRRRRGSRVGVGAAGRRARGQRRVAGTAAAAGRKAERGRESEQAEYACRLS